jgi:AcrR family transcriptional regulator
MFISVGRTKDLERKPALLAAIIDYLIDKPLSAVSFRTLAEGLSVSTFTLVYHFGTRAELIREVVQAVSERQTYVVRVAEGESRTVEVHLDNIRESWRLSLAERAQQLHRLEFEAAMLESREQRSDRLTQAALDRWNHSGAEALMGLGVAPEQAALEARIIVVTIYGLHYDLLVTGDAERVSATLEHALGHYEQRIRALIGV